MSKIVPTLWFDAQAEEAVRFYASIFPGTKIGAVSRYGEDAAKASGRPAGGVMTMEFELFGRPFLALNGGPMFKFTEAVSMMVTCDTQEELDGYWAALTLGGQVQRCGWLKDKYGLSWQIVPSLLGTLMGHGPPEKTRRVMSALLGMEKIDIQALVDAYERPWRGHGGSPR